MGKNELMIGDIVFHEKYGNAIIEAIDNDFGDNPSVKLVSENIKHKDGYKYGYCWCDLDEIFPIPLTPEILEKNYFKKCVVANGMEIDKKFNPYHITEQLYIHDGMCGTIVCCSDGGSTLSPLFECKYVNQLQHILKASGILNEIVL